MPPRASFVAAAAFAAVRGAWAAAVVPDGALVAEACATTSLVQLRSEARSSARSRASESLAAAPTPVAHDRARGGLEVLQQLRTNGQDGTGPIDCQAHPAYCAEGLGCQRHRDEWDLGVRLATADGRPNVQSWCSNYPNYEASIENCMVKPDLMAYAEKTFGYAKEYGSTEADASYCYLAGLWNDTSVTESTSVEEMVHICDARFGDGWKKFGLNDLKQVKIDEHSGFADRKGAIAFALMACASGNYHCDVMYCRETYCKQDYYVDKYSRLAYEEPGAGGHK